MTPLIIDASIAVKWVVDEAGTAEALALKRTQRLAAPDLLVAECANILWKKVRRGELSPEEASLAARLLQRIDIDLRPMRPFLDAATRIAVMLDHPAYDCLYLAMAETDGTRFVTADDRLLRKVRQDPTGRFAAMAVSLPDAF
ncbi:MAG: type II toxin-antitoxin system VapC family toxin [Rhodospirillaceae bacterium]